MKINVNQRCRVTLTLAGLKVYEKDYTDLGLKPRQLQGGVLETQLWELMRVFGPLMYLGAVDLPFQDNLVEMIENF